jgi:hypothetical protein
LKFKKTHTTDFWDILFLYPARIYIVPVNHTSCYTYEFCFFLLDQLILSFRKFNAYSLTGVLMDAGLYYQKQYNYASNDPLATIIFVSI